MNWLHELRLAIETALLDSLQKRCKHEPHYVTADVLEGEWFDKSEVQWCRRCGAYRRMWRLTGRAGEANGHYTLSDWTAPRASWTKRLWLRTR